MVRYDKIFFVTRFHGIEVLYTVLEKLPLEVAPTTFASFCDLSL